MKMYKYIYKGKENVFICNDETIKKCLNSFIFIDEEDFFSFEEDKLFEVNLSEETVRILLFKFGYVLQGFNMPKYVVKESVGIQTPYGITNLSTKKSSNIAMT